MAFGNVPTSDLAVSADAQVASDVVKWCRGGAVPVACGRAVGSALTYRPNISQSDLPHFTPTKPQATPGPLLLVTTNDKPVNGLPSSMPLRLSVVCKH